MKKKKKNMVHTCFAFLSNASFPEKRTDTVCVLVSPLATFQALDVAHLESKWLDSDIEALCLAGL